MLLNTILIKVEVRWECLSVLIQNAIQTAVHKGKMSIAFSCYNTDVLHPPLTTGSHTDDAINEKPPGKRPVHKIFIY